MRLPPRASSVRKGRDYMSKAIRKRQHSAGLGTSLIFLAGALALFSGCSREKPTVVIDHRWNADYAKESCRSLSHPCVVDPTDEVYEFESQLVTSFASDPTCSGVAVVGPRGKTGLEPYWLLMLDFRAGESAQNWGIVHTLDGGRARIREGEGDPKRIAHAVCAVLKQSGASVRD